MRNKNVYMNVLGVFFTILFVSYYSSITHFSHKHVIDGATIVHSHIHTDSHQDTQDGGHTEQCITLITQVSLFDYIDFSCDFTIAPQQLKLPKSEFPEYKNHYHSLHLEALSLRAPPVVC